MKILKLITISDFRYITKDILKVDILCCLSKTQQSTDRHIALCEHIILIPNLSVFDFAFHSSMMCVWSFDDCLFNVQWQIFRAYSGRCVLSEKAVCTNFIVFVWTHDIPYFLVEYAYYFTTEVFMNLWFQISSICTEPMKKSLNSDGQQLHQNQLNEQSPLTFTKWTITSHLH